MSEQPPFPPGPPRPHRDAGPPSWLPPQQRPVTSPPPAGGPAPYRSTTPYGSPAAPAAPAATGDPAAMGSTSGTGLPYHLLLRGGWDGTWWRAAVGLLCFALGMFVVVPALMVVPFAIYFVAAGVEVLPALGDLLDLTNPTPVGLAYLNLALAGLIPLTWLLVRYLHGLRPRWLTSVRPRLRWRYLVACFGLSFVALLATIVVASLLPSAAGSAGMSGELNDFTDQVRDFLLVILLLTPLQAAAEEYAFRGYLLQGMGGILGQLGDRRNLPWLRHPAFTVVVSSALFALAHGAQDAPIFFDRFAFGIVAATLVIVTGGLEAGIAMHVLNNWLAFGAALAYGDMASALNPSGGTWWSIPVTLTQSLVYLALAWWVARRMGLATRSDPTVLAAPETRV